MKKKLKCILLVDDDEDDNFFHTITLTEENIAEHVQVAESGMEALKMIRHSTCVPQLIFLDINMPKMNGWEFLKEYATLPEEQKSGIIIIMLTTSLNPADRQKADEISEVKGFENKPLTKEALHAILEKHF